MTFSSTGGGGGGLTSGVGGRVLATDSDSFFCSFSLAFFDFFLGGDASTSSGCSLFSSSSEPCSSSSVGLRFAT